MKLKHEAKKRTAESGIPLLGKDKQHKIALTHKSHNCDTPLEISDLLDALPFYVVLVDDQHHILQANSAVQTQLNLQPKDIVGKYCPKAIHGLDEPWYACPLEEAAEKNQAVEREALDLPSGRWVRSAIYPTRRLTREGRKIFFHMVTDITGRKEAEERAETAHLALKNYAAHMVNAQEEERRRIARELHDETIQALSLLYRKLDSLRTKAVLPASLVEELREAREINEGIVKGLRDLIKAVRPPTLDHLGIVASVRRLLLDFKERTGIKCQLKVLGDERQLPQDIMIGMFRIAQEALWNVGHHSKATDVLLTMTFAEHQARLDINDNGTGFNVPASLTVLSANGHLGLLGMQERAELLGGKLEIQSSPEKGTMIGVSIPIPQILGKV
jgi:two-component system sensor histidine kinase DegS